MSDTATPTEMNALVAMATAEAVTSEMRDLVQRAVEKALQRVRRAAGAVKQARTLDDLTQLRPIIQAAVNLQKPLANVRTPDNAAPFVPLPLSGVVASAEVEKRIQQVHLALHKADQKLVGALAALRLDATESERLVHIGSLARAVLHEFQAVPRALLKPGSSPAAPPPLPPLEHAVSMLDEPPPPLPAARRQSAPAAAAAVASPRSGGGGAEGGSNELVPSLPASPFSASRELVPGGSFAASREMSLSTGSLSSVYASGNATSPPSPTGESDVNTRTAFSSMLLLLSDALALPRAEVDKLLRVAGEPSDLLATVALESLLATAKSTLSGVAARNVQRQVRDAEQQRKARITDLVRRINDGVEAMFGRPWPFDEPDTDDNVIWITAEVVPQVGAAADDASSEPGRRKSAPGRVSSFTSKLKLVAGGGASSSSGNLSPMLTRRTRVLRGATLPKLLDLVLPAVRDASAVELATLQAVFVVTYETFAVQRGGEPFDGATLLAVLLRRHRGPRDAEHATQLFDTHKAQVRESVAELLYTWIERNPHSFFADDEFLARATHSFLRQALESKGAPARLKQAAQLLERQKLLLAVKPERRGGDTPLSQPLATADVGALCQEWCLVEYELFRAIAPREFLRQAWNKRDKATLAPNMLKYIDWFNQMSRWVQTAVLQGTTTSERAATIAFFVECGERLAALNNFNALMEILSALNGSSIFRLKRSWMVLPAAVVARFEALNERMSPSFNYKTYRAALAACQARGETYLAFMGVTHTDLTFSDDANEDYVGDSGARLNVEKAMLVGQAILACTDGLRQPYAFASRREQRALLLSGSVWDENEIYRISMMTETRLTDKEKAELESSGRRAARLAELSEHGLGQQRQVDTRSKLTDKDWAVLTALGQLETHEVGDCVINAGAALEKWLRVRSGQARVEVLANNEWQVVRELGEGALFGHAEALLSPSVSNQTLFRVVCAAHTELWQIRRIAVLPLLEADSRLSQRFWLHVAQQLADHLRALPFTRQHALEQLAKTAAAKPTAAAAAAAAAAKPAALMSRRRSLRQTAAKGRGIEADLREAALASYTCHVLHRVDSKGTLFVLKNRLVVLSTVFGVPRQRKLNFADIRAVLLDEAANRVTLRTSDGDETMLHRFKDTTASVVLSMIDGVRLAGGGAGGDDVMARRGSVAGPSEERDILTGEDWDVLTNGAKRLKLARDEVVVREGDVYQRLYQIASGSCRVQARSGAVLTRLSEGELFGEVSFVQRTQTGASATVIADSDDVELIVLEGYFVNSAIQIRDGFGGRFFRYVASVLAERIQKRESLIYDDDDGASEDDV